MASKIFKRGPKAPEMNMTPMIDVTFQLIIFFMLVNNIIAEESVEMIVPKLYDAKVKLLESDKRITVNVKPNPLKSSNQRLLEGNPWKYDGEAYEVKVGIQTFSLQDLDGVTQTLKEAQQKNPDVHVLLRADGALYYQSIQPVMNAITLAGIETVNLVAFMPDQGPTAAPSN
jgi:biopolymer transport protein TolR